MNEKDYVEILENLIKFHDENQIYSYLKKKDLFKDDFWRPLGDLDNNFSIAGNQQSNPEAALVEKLINSLDALLLGECKSRMIKPDGNSSPKNMEDAVYNFFGIKDGCLSSMTKRDIRNLEKKIFIVAMAKNKSQKFPSISIIDKGEGQRPSCFEDTFLSLSKSNKIKIPFVQGKYNMGGTGVLSFCGKYNFQLILSRRNPEIKDEADKADFKKWGFTLIYRRDPTINRKSSSYEYLVFDGKIASFNECPFKLIPGEENEELYNLPLEFGTYIKLYNYQLTPKNLQNFLMGLNFELNRLLPVVPYPIHGKERRNSFKAKPKSKNFVLLGIHHRLKPEDNFPILGLLDVSENERAKLEIYVLTRKKSTSKQKYTASNQVIFFTVNGQTHGFLPRSFLRRQSVNLSYIAEDMLVIIDCDGLNHRTREELFMASRDRLRNSELRRNIEKRLSAMLKAREELKSLNEERKFEMKAYSQDKKDIKNILEDLVKKNKNFAKLFGLKEIIKIENGFNIKEENKRQSKKIEIIKEKINLLKFPTFFQPLGTKTKRIKRECLVGGKIRINFSTDAQDDYFYRNIDPGDYSTFYNDPTIKGSISKTISLKNGKATLTLHPDSIFKVGDKINLVFQVNDKTQITPFSTSINIEIVQEKNKDRKKNKSDKHIPIPEIVSVSMDQNELWDNLKFNDESGVVIRSEENNLTVFVNMDNQYFSSYKPDKNPKKNEVIKNRYLIGMALISVAMYWKLKSKNEEDRLKDLQSDNDPGENIRFSSASIAPMMAHFAHNWTEDAIKED